MEPVNSFTCDEGAIAFIIPFTFGDRGDIYATVRDNDMAKKRIITFDGIKEEIDGLDKSLSQGELEEKKREIYDRYSRDLVESFKFYNVKVDKVRDGKPVFVGMDSYYRNDEYKGRNLNRVFSVSRKFHDDCSKDTPRLEVSLGSYDVVYNNGKDYTFSFVMDVLLLLTRDDKEKAGYLLLNIDFTTIEERGLFHTRQKLDRFIFLKHLFYKGNMKVIINGEAPKSLQEWMVGPKDSLNGGEKKKRRFCKDGGKKESVPGGFLPSVLAVLGLDYDQSINKADVKNNAFRYSFMELHDVMDAEGQYVDVSCPRVFAVKYIQQLYGLLVSDEGWRFVPREALLKKFEANTWSSRTYSCAIFLEHGGLEINQFKKKDGDYFYGRYAEESKSWFDRYRQKDPVLSDGEGKNQSNGEGLLDDAYYTDYFNMSSNVPGVISLTLYAFIQAIYKEIQLERAKALPEYEGRKQKEISRRFKELKRALDDHSMFFGEMVTKESIIESQFNIPQTVKELEGKYIRTADDQQSAEIKVLTKVTAIIALFTLLTSLLSVALILSEYPGSSHTVKVLICSLMSPLFASIAIVVVLALLLSRYYGIRLFSRD